MSFQVFWDLNADGARCPFRVISQSEGMPFELGARASLVSGLETLQSVYEHVEE